MLNYLRSDVYSRIQRVISIQDVDWLVKNPEDKDEEKIDSIPDIHFGLSMLTKPEFDLLFYRYFQGDSYKTLKKTNHLGSKKTAANRLKRLSKALRAYAIYHSTNDLENDLDEIEIIFGSDGRRIADMLFRRYSKTRILKGSDLRISRKRLFGMIVKMRNTFKKHEILCRFWNVIELFGKE